MGCPWKIVLFFENRKILSHTSYFFSHFTYFFSLISPTLPTFSLNFSYFTHFFSPLLLYQFFIKIRVVTNETIFCGRREYHLRHTISLLLFLINRHYIPLIIITLFLLFKIATSLNDMWINGIVKFDDIAWKKWLNILISKHKRKFYFDIQQMNILSLTNLKWKKGILNGMDPFTITCH